jgi:hypothetical protein
MFKLFKLRRRTTFFYAIDPHSEYVFAWDGERTLHVSIRNGQTQITHIGTWTLSDSLKPTEEDALRAVIDWLVAEFGSPVTPISSSSPENGR